MREKEDEFIDSHHIKCGVFCLTQPPDYLDISYYRAYVAYTHLTNWASVIENEKLPCVQSEINKMYWLAIEKIGEEEESNFFLFLMIGGTAVVVVVGAVILGLLLRRGFRKETNESNEGSGLVED